VARSDPRFLDQCAERWPDKLSRLRGGFYKIKDKEGAVVPFRMNADQEQYIAERHGFDIVLKARQKGFTTIIQLDMLDDCLFIPNTAAGVIAHNLTDAEAFFTDKIKFAYDELPDEFREHVRATQDSARSLKFSNGSSIRVGASLRSGTLQRLHVSEYGKLCAKFPEKAREVKSGAFNTVQAGQHITVESTAEGHAGHFYEITKAARDRDKQGAQLTALDFKFHFAPWWSSAEYALDADVVETTRFKEYFAKLAGEGVNLSREQRAWYIKKSEQQGEDMKREYPSTPDEAFEASIEGAYFSTEMAKMREQGRICRIPILNKPVNVYWDLGVGDAMALTFKQTLGAEERAVDYYENSGEGFEHYARVLNEKRYIYGRHYFPHDGDQRQLGLVAKTKKQWAEEAGIGPIDIVPRILTEGAGIEASRALLPSVWIDEERCARLIQCLDNYRKEWDDKLATWKNTARHDEFSHGYKSFETAAVAPRPVAHKKIDYAGVNRGIV
jgi:hypothetical protein